MLENEGSDGGEGGNVRHNMWETSEDSTGHDLPVSGVIGGGASRDRGVTLSHLRVMDGL